MALPQSPWTGMSTANTPLCGPFISSAGNTYVIARGGTTALRAYKVADPNSNDFAIVAASTIAPSGSVQGFHDVKQVGDVLHCTGLVSITGPSTVIKYVTFDMSTDTWSSVTDVNTISSGSTAGGIAIAVCGNGDIYIFHPVATETVMSAARNRISYSRKPSGSAWAAPVAFAPTGQAASYTTPAAVVGASDRVHCFYADTTNSIVRHRSISGTTMDTDAQVATAAVAPGNAVYDGTLVHVNYRGSTASRGILSRGTSQANPTWSSTTISDTNPATYIRTSFRSAMYGTTVHNVFQDATNFDFLRDVYPSPGADTTINTSSGEADDISMNVFIRGASVIIGWVYGTDTAGYVYDEEVIATVAGPIGKIKSVYPLAVRRAILR